MQYVFNVVQDGSGMGTDAEAVAVDAFNDKLVADGHWVFGRGLAGPDSSTVVDHRGGAGAIVTDGPFVETKEYIIGLWIVEADDLDVALGLADLASQACNRRIEVRPVL